MLFITHVYEDKENVHRLVKQINEHYPESLIYIVSDNPNQRDEWSSNYKNSFFFETNRRLKVAEKGVAWTKRYIGLVSGYEGWICKIDPDTYIFRRIEPIEDYDIIAAISKSFMYEGNKIIMTSGGIRFFHSNIAKEIMNTNILNSPMFTTKKFFTYYPTETSKELLASDDGIFGWCASRLGFLKVYEHPKVYCKFRNPIVNKGNKYAIISPYAK